MHSAYVFIGTRKKIPIPWTRCLPIRWTFVDSVFETRFRLKMYRICWDWYIVLIFLKFCFLYTLILILIVSFVSAGGKFAAVDWFVWTISWSRCVGWYSGNFAVVSKSLRLHQPLYTDATYGARVWKGIWIFSVIIQLIYLVVRSWQCH